MERKKIYIDIEVSKMLTLLLRDSNIPEKEVVDRLGAEIDAELHPDEDSPRLSASQIEKNMKDGGKRYDEFFFGTLTRLEDGTTVDLGVSKIIVADLLAQGFSEGEVREQVGETIWLLVQPPKKEEEKKEKKKTVGKRIWDLGKKLIKK